MASANYYTYYRQGNNNWVRVPIYASAIDLTATGSGTNSITIKAVYGGDYATFTVNNVTNATNATYGTLLQKPTSSTATINTSFTSWDSANTWHSKYPNRAYSASSQTLWIQGWSLGNDTAAIKFWQGANDHLAHIDINGTIWANKGFFGKHYGLWCDPGTNATAEDTTNAYNVGSVNKPIYISNGKPAEITKVIPTFSYSSGVLTITNY